MGVVIRGAGLAAGGYALAQILNLVVYVVLARLLVPEEFGTFAAATALLGFVLLVSESGMSSAVVQRRDRLEEAASTAVVATIVAGVLLGLLSLAIAPLLGLFFDSGQVTAVAAAMSGFILLRTATSVPDALLQRRFSFVRRLVIEPTQVIVFGTTAIICAENGLGVWSLVIGQYAGVLAELVLVWLLARWRPQLRLASVAMWRELVGFGRHIFVATAILNMSQQLDSLIVGRAFGTSLLGQFRYGFRIAATPFQALLAAAAYVLFPAFARIAEARERFEPAFIRSLRWVCMLAFPAGLILIPLGEPIAVIVFGEVWREAGVAATAMCAYPAAGMVSSVVSEALKAEGRPDRLTWMHSVTSGVTLALMVAMVPVGFQAVAAALSIGAVVGAVYALRNAHRFLGFHWRSIAAEIWPPAIAAITMALAIVPVEAALDAEGHSTVTGLLTLAGEGALALLVYGAVLMAISPVDRGELAAAARGASARLRRR